ncbi:MAG: T9SS type A sorting domain-containing protein [Candidatus Eisenbacteria bacterium]|nr:T9SS type A sorting domain-containing protein [Candidatus Eisenbacteria bacterium]
MSVSRRSPARLPGALAPLCLLFAVMTNPATAYSPPPVEPESLRAVVVTIDGIRDQEFHQWNGRLIDWIDSLGAYVPDLVNLTIGFTDPNHAILWGSGEPNQCRNGEGHPQDPMHFELIRKQRGLPRSATAFSSGKIHLFNQNMHSAHPDYGQPFEPCTLIARSDPPPELEGLMWYQGPDSLILHRSIEHLDTADVVWMGINLSEYDMMSHMPGLYACDFDTLCYWTRAEEIYREAERLVIEELWPFLQGHPRYRNRTVLIVATDHGRHLDDISYGFHNHGHGWLPDSSGCAPNCAGCREIWAMFIGPGVLRGTVASGTYSIRDVAPTLRQMMGFENPFETGTPISEILETLTSVDGPKTRPAANPRLDPNVPNPFRSSTVIRYYLPTPSPCEIRVYNAAGRVVFSHGWEAQGSGAHYFTWDGSDDLCRRLAPGVYFVNLRTDRGCLSRKVTLLR